MRRTDNNVRLIASLSLPRVGRVNPHAARSNLPAAARRAPVPDPRGGGADGVDGALAVNAFVVRGGLVRTHAKHDDPAPMSRLTRLGKATQMRAGSVGVRPSSVTTDLPQR